jgi:hypothetical protein
MRGHVMLLNKDTNCGGGRFGRVWGAGGAPMPTLRAARPHRPLAHARGDKNGGAGESKFVMPSVSEASGRAGGAPRPTLPGARPHLPVAHARGDKAGNRVAPASSRQDAGVTQGDET